MKLILSTLWTSLLGLVLLGASLFIPAGTLDYWQAWLFIAVFAVASNAIGIYLGINDPQLLERRKQVGPTAEKSVAQKIIVSGLILSFFATLVVSGLDRRAGWSRVPLYLALLGEALVVFAFVLYHIVLRENTYSSANIQKVEGQRVISTGPYARVRHPMYVGALTMAAGMPLALGSWWALALLPLMALVLAWRILDEERFLVRELPGYAEYMQKVRYRLVPHLW